MPSNLYRVAHLVTVQGQPFVDIEITNKSCVLAKQVYTPAELLILCQQTAFRHPVHFPNLMAGLQTRPAPSALPDVERQSVGGLVDGALVNLVDGRLVRVRVHVVGTV